MSRWNDTLQSPLRGNSSKCPIEMIWWPVAVRSVTPSSIGSSMIGMSPAGWGSGDTACDPAASLASTTPSALRRDAVACPVCSGDPADGCRPTALKTSRHASRRSPSE